MFAYDNLVQWFKDRCSDQVSRNVRRDGSLGRRYAVVTAEQWLGVHQVPGDESCVAWLESYCKRMR